MLKIGHFVNARAARGAICAYELCEEINALGHDARIYALSFDEHAPEAVRRQFLPERAEDPSWWREEALDGAVFYGVSSFSRKTLASARAAGTMVILECDSDGRLSCSQAPLDYLRHKMWDPSYSIGMKLRLLKAWLALLWRRNSLIAEMFSNLELAHGVKIESSVPAKILGDFLHKRRRADLAAKIVVIPFAVRDTFATGQIVEVRHNLIIAAGRLGSHQKGPALLASILEALSAEQPLVSVELYVRGAAPELETLAESHPRISVFHDSPAELVAARLAEASIFLSASRWESTPVAGLEALAMGCTLVAPSDLPGYQSLIDHGEYGCSYNRGSVSSAVRAICSELEMWSTKRRNAGVIASRWRASLALSEIAKRWIEVFGQPQRSGPATQAPACAS